MFLTFYNHGFSNFVSKHIRDSPLRGAHACVPVIVIGVIDVFRALKNTDPIQWLSRTIWFETPRHPNLSSADFQNLMDFGWKIFFKLLENFFFWAYESNFSFRMCLLSCIKSLQNMVDVREVSENIFQKNDPPPKKNAFFGGGQHLKLIFNRYPRGVHRKIFWG